MISIKALLYSKFEIIYYIYCILIFFLLFNKLVPYIKHNKGITL
jgi:hypothetical protein